MPLKNTILTLCSANYLAHAKTLGSSVLEHNSDIHFVIGLVDRFPQELKSSYCEPFEVIPVEEIGIPEFGNMVERYNIVELNTAVKPFYIEYLYRRQPDAEAIIYLDPDIMVFGSFEPLLSKLRTFNLIVTPHSSSFDDSPANLHYEIAMLRTGIYNLGFLATARTETTFNFLKWWQKRLVDYCYYRPSTGIFVDQQWVSLAPLYFDGIHVENDPGYNMCYWNHFERKLSSEAGRFLVNGKHPLIFYHFSNYSPLNPNAMANRTSQPIMTFSERPELRLIYDEYRRRLFEAGYPEVRSLKWKFEHTTTVAQIPNRSLKQLVQAVIRMSLRLMPGLIRKPFRRIVQFLADNSGTQC